MMLNSKEAILIAYQNKIQKQQSNIDSLAGQLNKISLSRLGLFVAEILLVAMIISWGFHWFYIILILLPLVYFLVLVKKQGRVQNELDYARQLMWVYQNEEDHLLTRANGYDHGEQFESESHPYTSDLDIFGHLSLYAYVNRCKTVKGMNLLAGHFNQALPRETILERQEAVKELSDHMEDSFHFRARLQNHQPAQLIAIEQKLAKELPLQLKFTRATSLRTYVKVVPFFMFALLFTAILMGGMVWNIFGLAALFNAALIFFNLKHINPVYYGFSGSAELLKAYSGIIEWTEKITWRSPYIRAFFSSDEGSVPVSREIKDLALIIQAYDARLNMIVAIFLNLFFLWDLKCAIRLDNWYKGSSEHILKGLDRISQFEELISLATLTYNEPEWNFPALSPAFRLEAVQVGHPLIEASKRIVNDYTLTGQPTVDIVTGSNMAGKSTFLRTMGINMVLAFAGAPVCAKVLNLSIFKVLSYMRIKDSLNDQTSTFKAELNRLKMILEASKLSANTFVLIDEMLRGTNSKDKFLGSKVFIERMIAQRTQALFATHDLALSEMEAQYGGMVRNYHFDIQITESEMHFDYKLKHGACKTFNAAILLKQIGLNT
ncbi:MutS-related protein [Pedobacter immunditicola]|uniref:MutS-related protein n=1 Tax=Pedobacter immunditicola TaxID=3133440 RepID=UPI0030B61DD2